MGISVPGSEDHHYPSSEEALALLQPRPEEQCPAELWSCLHPPLHCVRDSCSSQCWRPYPLGCPHYHSALLSSNSRLFCIPDHWVTASLLDVSPSTWAASPYAQECVGCSAQSMLETPAISECVFPKPAGFSLRTVGSNSRTSFLSPSKKGEILHSILHSLISSITSYSIFRSAFVMEERCVNHSKDYCSSYWETRGFVVKPQKTQGTEVNFDPHCGMPVCYAGGIQL